MYKYQEWEKPENLEKIRGWVKDGLTDRQIAGKIGVGPSVLSRWRRTKPKIRQAMVRLKLVNGKQIDAHDLHTGAPRKLDNVTALQLKVDTWIKRCKETKTPLTKTGLCLELHIGKDTLNGYLHDTTGGATMLQRSEVDGELRPVSISSVLKRAVMAIEENLEIGMITGKMNVTGCIFDLKNNHGYADKSEVTSIKTQDEKQTEEAIDKRLEELMAKAKGVVPFRKSG